MIYTLESQVFAESEKATHTLKDVVFSVHKLEEELRMLRAYAFKNKQPMNPNENQRLKEQ